MKIPKGIHPDYTIKEKEKNVDGYDTLSKDEEFEEALMKKQIWALIMKKVVDGKDVRADQMLDESSLITFAEGPTVEEIEARLREQAEREIGRQKEIFFKQLAEQKARLDEQEKQIE
uniref:Uncharacterized protein n=1 Tax=Romanomermis culicivorax TaxID=13658 RepID=A0A915I496_ROMCU